MNKSSYNVTQQYGETHTIDFVINKSIVGIRRNIKFTPPKPRDVTRYMRVYIIIIIASRMGGGGSKNASSYVYVLGYVQWSKRIAEQNYEKNLRVSYAAAAAAATSEKWKCARYNNIIRKQNEINVF